MGAKMMGVPFFFPCAIRALNGAFEEIVACQDVAGSPLSPHSNQTLLNTGTPRQRELTHLRSLLKSAGEARIESLSQWGL